MLDKLQAAQRVRVALIADTHGVLDERIAQRIAHCEIAVHAGDIGAALVLDALRPRLEIVLAIRGNNDVAEKWPCADRETLGKLSDRSSIDLPGGRLVILHGDRHGPAKRRHASLRQSFSQARAVVYGHSHRLLIDDSEEPWILNPGAAGRARTFGGPSCLVLIASPKRWRVIPYRFEPWLTGKKNPASRSCRSRMFNVEVGQ